MAYYTRDELLRVPIFTEATARTKAYHTKTAGVVTTVFLSHSHRDASILDQAIETIGSQGVKIYVDWKDDSMPSVTSAETAQRIKTRISECKKFVLLASENALASRWVPWELGIADLASGMGNVAILPVTDPPQLWTGSEYVGIYSRVEKADSGKPGVFEPGQTNGVTLEHWLLR